jgi:hypothetical protein
VAERKPDFLIIGAQKCATTWIHQNLREHPEIFLLQEKDLGHFFWTANREKTRTRNYLNLFNSINFRQHRLGEATSIYFWTKTGGIWDRHPQGSEKDIPKRIREELGNNIKLLLCLRDPVDRALSAFIHYAKHQEIGFDQDFFDCAWYNGIIDIGFYAQHLENWLGYFDLDQFLILNFEKDILGGPAKSLQQIFAFLGVATGFQSRLQSLKIFPGLPRVWRGQELFVTDVNGVQHRIANVQTIRELRDIYQADVAQLDRILGRNFSAPWQTVHSTQ